MLRGIESGAIRTVTLDTPEPSVFSHEILNANPYAYLDDAPLEERRARAVMLRRTLPADAADGDGHSGSCCDRAGRSRELARGPRCGRTARCAADFDRAAAGTRMGKRIFRRTSIRGPGVGADRDGSGNSGRRPRSGTLRRMSSQCCAAGWNPRDRVPYLGWRNKLAFDRDGHRDRAWRSSKRKARCCAAGSLRHRPDAEIEWCNRRVLARIHRTTLGRLRREIEPVTALQFHNFLRALAARRARLAASWRRRRAGDHPAIAGLRDSRCRVGIANSDATRREV